MAKVGCDNTEDGLVQNRPKQVNIDYRIQYNEQPTRDDTRDTCVVSRYFVPLRYTAVYRDLGNTGIGAQVSTINIEVSYNTINKCNT